MRGDDFAEELWLDLDCEMGGQADTRHCDFLFFGQVKRPRTRWVAAIEFKERRPTASRVTRQLQGGADHAAKLVREGVDVCFRPVVVFGGSMRDTEMNRFKRKTVTFRGKKEKVRIARGTAKFPMK